MGLLSLSLSFFLSSRPGGAERSLSARARRVFRYSFAVERERAFPFSSRSSRFFFGESNALFLFFSLGKREKMTGKTGLKNFVNRRKKKRVLVLLRSLRLRCFRQTDSEVGSDSLKHESSSVDAPLEDLRKGLHEVLVQSKTRLHG